MPPFLWLSNRRFGDKEQDKRHYLPASRKRPYEIIKNKESRVKNRELHPDREGMPISRREKKHAE
jgi:hypothetical protein